MSLQVFEKEVRCLDGIGDADRTWFPKWVRRYALSVRKGLVRDLPINRDSVIRFSRTLLESGAPAWQRWQAVRALECYRDLVLKRREPDLSDVMATLARRGWGDAGVAWAREKLGGFSLGRQENVLPWGGDARELSRWQMAGLMLGGGGRQDKRVDGL